MNQDTTQPRRHTPHQNTLANISLILSLLGFLMGSVALLWMLYSTSSLNVRKSIYAGQIFISEPSESFAVKLDSKLRDGTISVMGTKGWQDVQVFVPGPKPE